ASWPPDSSESEGKGAGAGIQELDLEGALANAARLADQLIQPLFVDHAAAVLGHVLAGIATRRLAINGDSKAHRLAILAGTEHQVHIARLEAEHQLPTGAIQRGVFLAHRPAASQRPLVELQAARCGV